MRVMHLIGMAKIWFEGAQATYLGVNISLLYTCTVVRENALRNWNWEKHNALLLFLSLVAFQLGGGRFCPPPPPPPHWLRLWRGRFTKASSWKILYAFYCLQYTSVGFTAGVIFRWNVSLLKYFLPTFQKKIPLSKLKNGCKIKLYAEKIFFVLFF